MTVKIPDEVWPITVDPAEFELALLNVGVNARDAMPNGGRFRVAARNITFSTPATGEGLTGDFVAVTLSDSGGGMPAAVSARAFEPFFTTKDVGSGSGLGLSQVYGFARQSGGGAVIDSEVGAGTRITLYLPRARTIAAAPRPSKDEDVPPALPARILHVEDDGAVAQVTAELLRDFGCSVVRARDGKDALAMLERDPTIELVISDIVMPGGMSGLELARTLRERHPRMPVLLTSGYSRSALQAINEGFMLVEKPYRRNVLAAAIRAALERREGRSEANSQVLLQK